MRRLRKYLLDIQYADADKNGARDYRNSLSKLDKCIGVFNHHNLYFVVNLGDMIDHDYLSFDKPLALLAKLKAPMYNVIGNHDFEVDDQFKDKIRNRLGNKNGYFDFTINNMVFIVLDGQAIWLILPQTFAKRVGKTDLSGVGVKD